MARRIDAGTGRKGRSRRAGLVAAAAVTASVVVPATATTASPVARTATGSADLSLTIGHQPSSPLSGDTVTISMVVANAGPDTAEDVVVGIAPGYTFQPVPDSLPEGCGYGGPEGSVLCAVGDVPSGTSTTVEVEALALYAGVYQVPGAVASETPDPDLADRATTDTILVRQGPTQFERALGGMYQDVLGRAPTAPETAYWNARWKATTFYPDRYRVPLAIIASTESARRRVGEAYTRLLGRPAGAGDLAYWSAALARGLRFESLEATLVASGEFRRRSGGTDAAVVDAAHHAILHRAPTAAERQAAVAALGAGGTAGALASSLQRSHEYRARVVDALVRRILDREATNFDRLVWVGALNRGAGVDRVWAEMLASGEYLSRFPGSEDYYEY